MQTSPSITVHLTATTPSEAAVFESIASAAGLKSGTTADADVTVIVSDAENALDAVAQCSARPLVAAITNPSELSSSTEASIVIAGADAVLLNKDSKSLQHAVNAVMTEQTVVSESATRVIANQARDLSGEMRSELTSLTTRELDILHCVGRGESVRKTAATLNISPKTVENLQSRLFRKLNVKNRRDAYKRAQAMGMIPVVNINSNEEKSMIEVDRPTSALN